MEAQELKNALDALKTDLEGKSKQEVKNALEAFEATLEGKFDGLIKSDELEAKFADLENAEFVKKMQDHLDSLDVKVNKAEVKSDAPVSYMKAMKDAIRDGFDSIKAVRKGVSHTIELKAVGDMTLGNNLVGDQPRSYSDTVAVVPNQILNFSELVGTINIGNGTYTFPREGAGEGAAATQTEGATKAQIDTDITMVDVNTDFIAGYSRYSKKMANNLPFLESFLPGSLRRKYFDAENSVFNTALASAATASTEVITGQNKIEMLIAEIATLEASNFSTNGIVVSPADFWDILVTEKSTGAGYGLPGVVQVLPGGGLSIAGIPVYRCNFLAANKYYVGDWSTVSKVVTEGLSVEFSTEDGTNFRDNMISARVESQCGLAIHRPDAIIYGDFTAS